MAKKKVGELIREARKNAGLTQAELAKKVSGLSATDISKAERGEKELTQSNLKQIAKATGVTQASLLNAPKGGTSSSASSSSPSSGTSVKLTATEKKLIELYRAADSSTKKSVMSQLKGEKSDAESVLSSLFENAADILGSLTKEIPQDTDTATNE